jgi:DNA-binding transcriptional MerR regulator
MAEEQLYTVTELAKELGMTPRAIRFYEDKGLIAPRRAGANRVYTPRDRARMIVILRGKRLGFSLSEIKDYIELYDADPTQRTQMLMLKEALAKRREQLSAQRAAIDEALSELDEIAAQTEAALQQTNPRLRRAS